MADELLNNGEEYTFRHSWTSTGVTFLLYDDSTDALDDTSDLGDITTEPGDGNYSRQTATVQDADYTTINGNQAWELSVAFDVTNTTGSVDATGAVVNYQSDLNGDSSAQDHLVAAGFLSSTRNLSDYDQVDITFQLILD